MPGNEKPKLAMYWLGGCGGCEIAVLNLFEGILEIDANFEVVFWPVAMDAKVKDVKALPDGSITVCLITGSIRTNEHEEMAHLLRRKSKILVAFGSCAYEGGIPGLANSFDAREIIHTAFHTPTTENPEDRYPQPKTAVPEGEMHLPTLLPVLKALDQVVRVDYYLPGCPPESEQIGAFIHLAIQALNGEGFLPPAGSVVGAGRSTVCDECPRARAEKIIHGFRRMATFQPDEKQCLLEQGILCSGVATRGGCQALCPQANVPCIGCYGPAPEAADQGARMLSAVASVVSGNTCAEIDPILDGIVDPVGTFYRFGLAHSLLRHAKRAAKMESKRSE